MTKKILVTGSKGFLGKNLLSRLKYNDSYIIYEYDKGKNEELLYEYCRDCDFIFHLAGVNRTQVEAEFMSGNYGLTEKLIMFLKQNNNFPPIMFSSSVQAGLENPYGISKKAAEDLLATYRDEVKSPVYIYRFPNIFGKWGLPDYNSVVATFCHNVANRLEIRVDDPEVSLKLVYIDDVIQNLITLPNTVPALNHDLFCSVSVYHITKVGELASIIRSFSKIRSDHYIPYLAENSLEKKLYSTYLSYIPTDSFAYSLDTHTDDRGSFTELFRTIERGQISANISKPGVEKGNHWHDSKCEKFCVVSGCALIQFRIPNSKEIISYHVSGEKIEIVDIPCGYSHNIINEGDTDLITIMWCNECFNPESPDTHYSKVAEN